MIITNHSQGHYEEAHDLELHVEYFHFSNHCFKMYTDAFHLHAHKCTQEKHGITQSTPSGQNKQHDHLTCTHAHVHHSKPYGCTSIGTCTCRLRRFITTLHLRYYEHKTAYFYQILYQKIMKSLLHNWPTSCFFFLGLDFPPYRA